MTTDLRDALRERLDSLPMPPGDLDRVHAAGTMLRRRRAAAIGAVSALAVAAVLLGFAVGGSDGPQTERGIDPIGRLDLSDGLRAYADPGRVIHLGDREIPAPRLDNLDIEAVATPYGILYYDSGFPALLEGSGEINGLEEGAGAVKGKPSAKVDAQHPWVAYATTRDGDPQVVVRDLSSGEVVARRVVEIGTIIDAMDDGVVFLRTPEGTSTWDVATDEVQELAGRRTSVADVRNGVLLYDGPAPTGPAAAAYRLVPGAIDAQLTYDGGHVLYWSDRLESTDGGRPIVLDQKASFFAIDTDGSILAATAGSPARFYDCELPSGRCTSLGSLEMTGGDPMFIGTDM
jgi:hypothetical protein